MTSFMEFMYIAVEFTPCLENLTEYHIYWPTTLTDASYQFHKSTSHGIYDESQYDQLSQWHHNTIKKKDKYSIITLVQYQPIVDKRCG